MYFNLSFLLSVVPALQVAFLAICIGYCLLICSLLYGWRRLVKKNNSVISSSEIFPVTMVIPFRNEAENLPKMAGQVKRGIPEAWQVIWVDDHSEDESWQCLVDFMGKERPTNWLLMSSDGVGKKHALNTGVSTAKYDLIVTTDADVLFEGNPFLPLVRELTKREVHLVAGPVFSVSSKGFFSEFQLAEWASIQLVTGASFGLGAPLMCSGANLCFRRSSFWKVGGYEGNFQHLSGDDEFLLKKITERFGVDGVCYLPQREAVVFTQPFESWKDLIRQRRRWVSKWKVHRSAIHAASSLASFLFPAAFLFSPLLLVAGHISVFWFFMGWLGKVLADWMALRFVTGYFRLPLKHLGLFFSTFVHPVFVVWVGFGVTRGNFTWKGRKSELFH